MARADANSMHTDPATYEVTSHAIFYDGVMTALPVPSTEAYASDINDSGVVVGTMTGGGGFGRYHAYIYADGVVTSLNRPDSDGLRPRSLRGAGHQQCRPDRRLGLRLARPVPRLSVNSRRVG